MTLTEQEITLQAALQDFGLTMLPKEIKKDSGIELIEGIALVTKSNGMQGYVKVSGDGEGGITIKKDYGHALLIRSIDKLYPVQTLDAKRFKPDLRSDKQIIKFLCKSDYDEAEITALLSKDNKTPDKIKSDRDIIKKYINTVAIKIAKQKLQEEERIEELKSYASRINNGKEN